jgi:hypothetical protein
MFRAKSVVGSRQTQRSMANDCNYADHEWGSSRSFGDCELALSTLGNGRNTVQVFQMYGKSFVMQVNEDFMTVLNHASARLR